MQSFEIEIDAMHKAQARLAEYRGAMERYRDLAAGLTNSVPKSTTGVRDPVADKLHQIYFDRAHPQGGVQGVLDHYLTELERIQGIIAASLAAYSAAERDAADRYRSIPGEAR